MRNAHSTSLSTGMGFRGWVRIIALSLLLSRIDCATPQALSVTPSTNWYGDDGTWSAVSIRVGSPAQWVDVFPNTISSGTWVIGNYGCDNNTVCSSQRGGLFNLADSSSWNDQGFFYLGDDQVVYGQYGLDDLTFGTTGVTIESAIIASINDTEIWVGQFGLGITPEVFTSANTLSAISNLVEKKGAISSHSYGFTAGAKYQENGETASLTLGGYDENRFVPHNVTFELNPSQYPQVYINSASVLSSASSNDWTTPVQLLNTVDRVSAVINSTTPYLWLPPTVCERFAVSLGLTYNKSLNIYTFDGDPAQHEVLEDAQLTFTFALSALESSQAIVNITLPYVAFDLQLTYPAIPSTNYGDANSTVNYFPLKQASNEAEYIIGRSFLQEAYLITDYERNTFSVHQAVHVANPIGNTSIVPIPHFANSTLSSSPPSSKDGFSTGAVVGIAIGVLILIAFICFAIYRVRLRNDSRRSGTSASEKAFSQRRQFISRFRRRRPSTFHEIAGNEVHSVEVSADSTHECFELPAPLGPVELDGSETGIMSGLTERGSSSYDSLNISAYERARRKLEHQQNYIPPRLSTSEPYPIEKNGWYDISPVTHHRPETVHHRPENLNLVPYTSDSPLVSPVGGASSRGSFTISETTSPVTSGFPLNALASPPPVYRRVNPQNVVYAGRLPEDHPLPGIVPRMIGSDGHTMSDEQTLDTEPDAVGSGYGSPGQDTFGSVSNSFQGSSPSFHDLYGSGSEYGVSAVDVGEGVPRAPRIEDESKFLREDIDILRSDMQSRQIQEGVVATNRRRLQGDELVHVPQPSENRFSWEEEIMHGTD